MELYSKVFVSFNPPYDSFDVRSRLRISGQNYETKYIDFIKLTIENSESHEYSNYWYELEGKAVLTITGFEQMNENDLDKLTCRYQVSVSNPIIDFKIDHVYVIPESKIDKIIPLNGFVMNPGFEISKDSIYFDQSSWSIPSSSKAEVIYSEHDAPEGFNFIKISNRKSENSAEIEQNLHLGDDFNPDNLLEMRYWAKFDYESKNDIPNGENRHNDLFMKLIMTHYPQGLNGRLNNAYIQCHKACIIPGMTHTMTHTMTH